MQDLPSFLQEVTTVRGQLEYATKSLRAECNAARTLAEVDEIELSQMDRLLPLSEMAAAAPPTTNGAAHRTGPNAVSADDDVGRAKHSEFGALVPKSERFAKPFPAMLALVLARQKALFVRDVTLVRARVGQCVIMGLLIGGLWFQEPVNLESSRCDRMSPSSLDFYCILLPLLT
jgi:hypothetical protein